MAGTTAVGKGFNDLGPLAAGKKTNLKKRIATPDIFPNAKRPKLNSVNAAIDGVSSTMTEAFMSTGIRSGTSQQLLRQLGHMNGNMPSLAYAHIPIDTITPGFRPSRTIAPNAEAGELTLVFTLSNAKSGSHAHATGGGIRLVNWQLAMLKLAKDTFFKEEYEVAATDPKLAQLDDPEKIADLCALLGPVYIPDVGKPGFANKSKTKAVASTDFVVQVSGLAEGESMKDIWPGAPENSRLFLELRKVEFDERTCFFFKKAEKLPGSIFPVGGPKQSAYQIVPTFIPPSFGEYLRGRAKEACYSDPDNYRVEVGRLLFREQTKKKSASELKVTPAELARGVNWTSCGSIKVLLSTHTYWKGPIGGARGAAAGAAAAVDVKGKGHAPATIVDEDEESSSGDYQSGAEDSDDMDTEERLDDQFDEDITEAVFH